MCASGPQVPTEALAWALAAEWDAQINFIRPHSMPLLKFALAAIDRMPQERHRICGEVRVHMNTELACMHSEKPALQKLHHKFYLPLLGWLKEAHGVALVTRESQNTIALPQNPKEVITYVCSVEVSE
jgi:ATP synthase F1 complex assembly factor 2